MSDPASSGPRGDALVRLLLKDEVERFLFHEARLLDERRFREWLLLFTDDIHYFMPTRYNRPGQRADEDWAVDRELVPPGGLAWFDDDKAILTQRVVRLETGEAWAETPPSRTRHFVSNVEVTADAGAHIEVRSNFLVYRSRLETEEDLFVGVRHDRLRRSSDGLRIARRKIIYDATVSPAKNMSIFF